MPRAPRTSRVLAALFLAAAPALYPLWGEVFFGQSDREWPTFRGEAPRDPERHEAAARLTDEAEALVALGPTELERAASLLEESTKLDPFSSRALLLSSRVYLAIARCCQPGREKNTLERAVEAARSALAVAGNDDAARSAAEILAGQSLYLLGRRREAKEAFDNALRWAPDSIPPEAWFALGEIQREAGELESATHSFGEASSGDPGRVDCRRLLAATRLALGDFEEARAIARAALGETAASPSERVRLLAVEEAALVALGRDQEAAAIHDALESTARELPPGEYGTLLLAIAETLIEARRDERAIATLDEARTVESVAFEAAYRLALVQFGLGRRDRASEIFEEIERTSPESFLGPFGRGEIALLEGRLEDAGSAFEEAARRALLDPAETGEFLPRVLRRQAQAHALAGRTARARLELERALELAPDSFETHLSLCRLLAQIRLDEEAERIRLAYAERNPDSWPAHFMEGLLSAGRGEHAKAQEAYEKSLERHPDPAFAPWIETELAASFILTGDDDGAREPLARAIALDPFRFDAYLLLAKAYDALGRHEESLEQIQFAIHLRPRDAESWYNQACLQAKTGRIRDALASFATALEFGFSNLAEIEVDPDLDPLRDLSEFRRILARTFPLSDRSR